MPINRRQRLAGYIVGLILIVLRALPMDIDFTSAQEPLSQKPSDAWLDAGFWVPLFSLALMVFLWSQLGRSRKVSFYVDYLREPPYSYGPAVVGWLFRFGKSGMSDMVATMMHLAHRGILEIRKLATSETQKPNFELRRVRDKEAGLAPYEKELLEYVFGMIAVCDHMTFKDIQNYADYFPQRISRFLKRWSKSIAAETKKYDFFEKQAPFWLGLNLIIGAATAFIGIVVIQIDALQGGLALLIGALQLGLTFFMKRRTQTGEIHYQKWLAFRRFLTDFSNLDTASPQAVIIWENYLIYALSLGVAGEVKRQLQIAPYLDVCEHELFDSMLIGVELVFE